MTSLRVEIGRTINDGNFGSVKFDFSIEDEPRKDESVPEAFNRIYNFVESLINAKIDEAQKDIRG